MIIEVDEYKSKVENYNPNNSEDFHIESAKLADADFINCLKSKKYKRIIFMAGGTASGKTEFASQFLNKKDQLVYDGTLKSFEGFNVKLDKIKRYDKNNSKVKVVLIIPKDWVKSFDAFLTRERKMSPQIFFETHIKSKVSVAEILLKTKIKLEIYVSVPREDKDKIDFVLMKRRFGRISAAKDLVSMSDVYKDIATKNGFDINE